MTDELFFDAQGPVLLVGGYGTVGTEVARMAAREFPLLLTGRSPERGRALATETDAALQVWDLADPKPFRAGVRAVVGVVNDPDDRVLRAAIAGGVPFTDVTRWTARMQRAVTVAALLTPQAPVLLSSAWMGGVTSLVAAHLAARLGGAERVDIAIRWDLADRAGADSVEFMDRLGLDFEVVTTGARHMVMPLSEVESVRIGDTATKVARLDTPEQFTLPLTLGTATARTRIGFSSGASTSALLLARRIGLFRWGRGPAFTSTRRSLLYSPGEGGTAQVRIDIVNGDRTATAHLRDPAGQAHLTAVGAVLGLRRTLGLDGAPADPGIRFPEQTPLPEQVPDQLAEYGVGLRIDMGGARLAA
ncbi:saccharopine dehydrogenase [Nocardia panacis]|uniref:Saccharopine dehydrogenase n=1 Tax=Nocardia panacis TaxID=2340916 RepID=A0A3A4JPH7_9NOCA|nr:saccharopine dehydrogenase [Nocardia panacis]RJO70918.1 saccharopine dehydrogenase [Nocardia panacis]